MKTRFTIALAAFLLTIGAATAYARKLYATFGTPASSATYKSPTYTWAANTNNLMPMFTFANGELADYETLCFTFANISSEASVRVGVYYTDDNGASTWRQMGGAYYSPGTKTVNLAVFASESNIDLAKVTGICFGGNGWATDSQPASVDIVARQVYLENGDFDPLLYATFGTPANNASYDDATETYSWTLGYSNLMPVFTFANGELTNYKTLSFTFSDYKVESGSGGVRIGVYHTTDGGGSTWKQMGDSFYANGTKTIDLEAFAKESGVDLAKVTSICFGGSNGAGSVTLKPSEMYIAMGTSAIHDSGSETKAAAAGVAYDLHGRLTKPNAKGMVIVGGKKHFNK